jgi:hypothetical protein
MPLRRCLLLGPLVGLLSIAALPAHAGRNPQSATAALSGTVESVAPLYDSAGRPSGCSTSLRVGPGVADVLLVDWIPGVHDVADACRVFRPGDGLSLTAEVRGYRCNFDICRLETSLAARRLDGYRPRR